MSRCRSRSDVYTGEGKEMMAEGQNSLACGRDTVFCSLYRNEEIYKKKVQQLAEKLAETNAYEAIKKFGRQVEAREPPDNSSSSTH